MHPRRHSTCCNGHDLTLPDALYVRRSGYTDCRVCRNARVERCRKRKRVRIAIEELQDLRARAMRNAPSLVPEIVRRIERLRSGEAPSVVDTDRDLAALVEAESLPAYLRQRAGT